MKPKNTVEIQQVNIFDIKEVTCSTCGEILDLQNNLWVHYCFSELNPAVHIFNFTRSGRLYAEHISKLNTMDEASRDLIIDLTPYRNHTLEYLEYIKNNGVPPRQAHTSFLAPMNDSGCYTEENGLMYLHQTTDEDSDKQLAYDMELISLVRQHEHLWDHINTKVEERGAVQQETRWVKIANILNKPVKEVKKRWADLKKKYSDAKDKARLSAPSGSGTDNVNAAIAANTDFPLYNDMKFIDDVVTPIQTSDSLPDSDTNVLSTIEQYEKITGKNKPKKRKAEVAMSDFDSKLLDCLDQFTKENNNPENEIITSIILMVKSSLKRFPEDEWLNIQADLIHYFQRKTAELKNNVK